MTEQRAPEDDERERQVDRKREQAVPIGVSRVSAASGVCSDCIQVAIVPADERCRKVSRDPNRASRARLRCLASCYDSTGGLPPSHDE
jgi:hypothetical protein